MLLLHGTADKSATAQSTLDFAAALEDLGVDVHTKLYEGWTHTDPILERPFAGDQRLHRDLLEAVSKWCDGPWPLSVMRRRALVGCARRC